MRYAYAAQPLCTPAHSHSLPALRGGKIARLIGRCARTTHFENHTVKSSVDAPSMN